MSYRVKYVLLYASVIIPFIFAILIMLDFSKPGYYDWLFLLPLIYSLSSLVHQKIYNHIFDNIGVFFIIGQLFIRNVIIPILMCYGDYSSLFVVGKEANVPKAIFLMAYEMVVCFSVVRWSLMKNYSGINNHKPNKRKLRFNAYEIILLTLMFICVFLWYRVPELKEQYRSFLELFKSGTKDNTYSVYNEVMHGSTKRIFLTLFTVIFDFIQILVPAYGIVMIQKKVKVKVIGLCLSVMLIATQLLFVNAAVAINLINMILLLQLVAIMYPQYKRTLFLSMLIAILAFSIAIFSIGYLTKSGIYSDNFIEYLSILFNSYFTGVDNVAATFNITDNDKLRTFLYSLYSTIPFRNTLFPLNGTSFVNLYTGMYGLAGQIPSNIGFGWYYFSFIFAPLVNAITSNIAVKYGEKQNTTKNIWRRLTYLLLSMYMSFNLGIYNIIIVMSTFFNKIIPMLVISRFASDKTSSNIRGTSAFRANKV